jgi:hypothetical protein
MRTEKNTYLIDDVLEVLPCGLFGLQGRRDHLEHVYKSD